MGKARAFGALLIFSAIVTFIVNMGIWHPFPLNLLPAMFWNPLSYFTTKIVGNIWLISSALATILNFLLSILYSFILFVVGLILVK